MHGIAPYKLVQEGKTMDEVDGEIMNGIIKNGLNIEVSRRLLGTVAFTNYSKNETEEQFVNKHTYGESRTYIIIALPKILRNRLGEGIYVGSPQEGSRGGGYDITSLSDALLPDYAQKIGIQYSRGNLSNKFILGAFTRLNDKKIALGFNPEHIYYKNGIVPDDFFETRKQKLLSPDQTYNTKIFIMGNTSASELKRNQDLINIDMVEKFSEYLEDDWRMCEKLDEMSKDGDYIGDIMKKWRFRGDWIEDNETHLIGAKAFRNTIIQYAQERYGVNLAEMLAKRNYNFKNFIEARIKAKNKKTDNSEHEGR